MLNHTERKALQRRMPYPPPAPLPTDYSVSIPNTAAEVREAFGSLPGEGDCEVCGREAGPEPDRCHRHLREETP